jgi:hypothetical protein
MKIKIVGQLILWDCVNPNCGRGLSARTVDVQNGMRDKLIDCPGKAYEQCDKQYLIGEIYKAMEKARRQEAEENSNKSF